MRNSLQALSGDGLNISIQADSSEANTNDCRLIELSLIGNDRPGIVRELSSALAGLQINVCEMNTYVTSAPMTADPLFKASAQIQIPRTLDINELSDKLDDIANQLDVDITLEN